MNCITLMSIISTQRNELMMKNKINNVYIYTPAFPSFHPFSS